MQVLDSPTHGAGPNLPDDIPGQVNPSPPQSFSFFSARQAAASPPDTESSNHGTWTYDNAATSGLQLPQQPHQPNSAGSNHSSQSTEQLPYVPSCLTPQQGGAGNGVPARYAYYPSLVSLLCMTSKPVVTRTVRTALTTCLVNLRSFVRVDCKAVAWFSCCHPHRKIAY